MAKMAKFVIKGKMNTGFGWENFRKNIEAEEKEQALDRTFCMLGGCHGLKRNRIKIESVTIEEPAKAVNEE